MMTRTAEKCTTATRVLVLDGSERAALAVTRSLGRSGCRVTTAAPRADHLAGASRFAASSATYVSPCESIANFVRSVLEIVRREDVDFVIPVTDATITALYAAPPTAMPCRVMAAAQGAYELLSDKARLAARAGALGILVPETIVVRSEADACAAARALSFPCVLKPARSKLAVGDRIRSFGVSIASSVDDVAAFYTDHADVPVLVQRFVPGRGAGVFALFRDGEPRAWFAHRRLREKPPWGGVSVLSQSANVDPELASHSERLLADAGWTGPAMVEFRIDPSGRAYLMEVNARLWGSVQLAIDAGVDFPSLWYSAVSGTGSTSAPDYRVGNRLHWFLGDVDSLIARTRRSGSAADVLAHAASLLWNVVRPGSRSELCRLDDPKPALVEARQWWYALRPKSAAARTQAA